MRQCGIGFAMEYSLDKCGDHNEAIARKVTSSIPRPYITSSETRDKTLFYLAERRKETAQSAIAKFIDHIGDRNGLVELRTLFDHMDADQSGSLSYEEFRNGLNDYGMDLTDSEVSDLLKLLDANGDGELSLEEFSAIAKNELEMADLQELWENAGVTVDSSIQDLAIMATSSGTRFTRTESVLHDLKRQGKQFSTTL